MSKPGWWDVHRMLRKGHRGPDVSELQRLLVQDSGDRIPISGYFGDETEKAVKAFQQRNDLAHDGLVGPVTFSVLAEGNYRFQLPNPKLIRQESYTCWAAALESALQTNWGIVRQRLTVADMLAKYSSFLAPKKDITVAGFGKLVRDIAAHQKVVSGKKLPLEGILRQMSVNRSVVVLVHDLTGSIAHTVVIYGVKIVKGEVSLLVMDPLAGAYLDLSVGVLRQFTSDLRIVTAQPLN